MVYKFVAKQTPFRQAKACKDICDFSSVGQRPKQPSPDIETIHKPGYLWKFLTKTLRPQDVILKPRAIPAASISSSSTDV